MGRTVTWSAQRQLRTISHRKWRCEWRATKPGLSRRIRPRELGVRLKRWTKRRRWNHIGAIVERRQTETVRNRTLGINPSVRKLGQSIAFASSNTLDARRRSRFSYNSFVPRFASRKAGSRVRLRCLGTIPSTTSRSRLHIHQIFRRVFTQVIHSLIRSTRFSFTANANNLLSTPGLTTELPHLRRNDPTSACPISPHRFTRFKCPSKR
jgi:hypothetical protein